MGNYSVNFHFLYIEINYFSTPIFLFQLKYILLDFAYLLTHIRILFFEQSKFKWIDFEKYFYMDFLGHHIKQHTMTISTYKQRAN